VTIDRAPDDSTAKEMLCQGGMVARGSNDLADQRPACRPAASAGWAAGSAWKLPLPFMSQLAATNAVHMEVEDRLIRVGPGVRCEPEPALRDSLLPRHLRRDGERAASDRGMLIRQEQGAFDVLISG
jgi:hypothetical protein